MISTILDNLWDMPIFKMSLGSKELFHSNFLEFLWDVNNDMFIEMVNGFLNKNSQQPLATGPTTPKYELSREKENFDICIFHKEGNGNREKTVYDLVIENKVKSMPLKEQLERYVNTIQIKKKQSRCRFILLSLATVIPDVKEIKKTWTIVNYHDLKNAIESKKSNWQAMKLSRYIQDYCDFIGKMHDLQNVVLDNFLNSFLFQDVEQYRGYRLHDLYIKLRCDLFLVNLKNRLKNELQKLGQTLPITFISKYSEIQKKGIYLNTSINQGVGQAAAFIHLHDGQPVNNYEIVIQGKQYRHGINSKKGKDPNSVRAQEQIWNAISKKEQDFLVFNIYHRSLYYGQSVLPDKCKTVKGVRRTVPLNGYDTTCIYKHVDIVEETPVGDLLDYMAKDITKTIDTFK